ncbi:MAG TPA: hypothetical protein VMV86_06145 [Methanosarcinales archaeon]|nr:hypothetical protein [Methanosarcinales archaeon]
MEINYLYHLTHTKNLDNIQKHGLLAHPPESNWGGANAPLPSRIYLCAHPALAGGTIDQVLMVRNINVENILMDEDAIWPYWDMSWEKVNKECKKKTERKQDWLIRIIHTMGLCGGLASLALNGTCSHIGNISTSQLINKGHINNYARIFFNGNIALQNARRENFTEYAINKFAHRGAGIVFPELMQNVLHLLQTSLFPIEDLIKLERERFRNSW